MKKIYVLFGNTKNAVSDKQTKNTTTSFEHALSILRASTKQTRRGTTYWSEDKSNKGMIVIKNSSFLEIRKTHLQLTRK